MLNSGQIKPNKFLHVVFIVLFLSILGAIPLFSLFSLQKDVSPYEFRSLQKKPVFSPESLRSGQYFADWGLFYKDHFFARDAILRLNVFIEMNILSRCVINDVFESENHVLPLVVYKPPADNLTLQAEAAAERLALVRDKTEVYGGTFLFVGIPSQTSAFIGLYPDGMFTDLQNQTVINEAFFAALDRQGIRYVDMAEVFSENGGTEPYYLKTDHHINLRGAILTCSVLQAQLRAYGINYTAPTADNLRISTLPNEVLGSRGRRLYGLSSVRDELEVFSFVNEVPFTRTDNGLIVNPSVLSLPEPDGFASYSVYMGGDIAETVIQTNRSEKPSLLVYGDSYTNVIETLLYEGFNETRSLDLRYYSEMGILDYIELYKPDVVLLIRDDHFYIDSTGNGMVR